MQVDFFMNYYCEYDHNCYLKKAVVMINSNRLNRLYKLYYHHHHITNNNNINK